MMNSGQRVFKFVLVSFSIYLGLSLLSCFVKLPIPFFEKINLLSDIVNTSENNKKNNVGNGDEITIEQQAKKDFELYNKPDFITNFNADTSQPSLLSFVEKIHQNITGKKKRKIRIAYFGDSMIEGDLICQTLRDLLQKKWGGSGVGFVPVTSIVAGFRQTASTMSNGNWKDESFKDKKKNLYISGHVFSSSNGSIILKDNVVNDSTATTEKSLLCGWANNEKTISYNNKKISFTPQKKVNRILLDKSFEKKATVTISDPTIPIYGISFESENGIIVDNFSFRGISGIEFSSIDNDMLSAIAAENDYDLIIFQYGVNVLYKPNDINFNWYAKAMAPIIKNFKKSFPNSDFLLISTADRAFRYDGEYKSAVGIDSLVKLQAKVAFDAHICFYNLFQTMGGKNAIVKWVQKNPPLAGKDYVHPNSLGAKILGEKLFDAILNDYNKYLKHTIVNTKAVK